MWDEREEGYAHETLVILTVVAMWCTNSKRAIIGVDPKERERERERWGFDLGKKKENTNGI